MLKFRKPQNVRIKQEDIDETSRSIIDYEEEKKENISINHEKKRIKERVIGDVIEKVVLWRKMHEGIEENGKKIQIPLDVAAQRVGISKKTLDDYLFQIKFEFFLKKNKKIINRLGKKYNFNFKDHQNDKIGILRAFVKKNRQLERDSEKGRDENNVMKQHIQNTFENIYNQQTSYCSEHTHCPNCMRTSSPTCKKEANNDFDIISIFFLSLVLKTF